MIDGELERIRRAYGHYDSDAAERAKRDPANAGNLEIGRRRETAIRDLLARRFPDLASARILDAGCGSGATVGLLLELGATPSRVLGVDLLPDRIEAAQRSLPNVRFECRDLRRLSNADASFDLVVCSLLFGSILDEEVARQVAAELRRVLAPGGCLLWYESRYANPWNADVRGWNRRQVAALFPDLRPELRPITLLPPVARRLGRWSRVYPALAAVRPLRSHYVGLLDAR